MTGRAAPAIGVVLALATLTLGCSGTRFPARPVAAPTVPQSPVTIGPVPIRRVRAPDPPVNSPAVPAPLYANGLDIRSGPVPVPIRLQIPSLLVDASVLGVGVLANDVMDAPEGPIHDPVWQAAFWYRGSAIPGVLSTAVIAGHVDGPRGTDGVFGHIEQLRAGATIIVHDTRNGLDVRFRVTGSADYTLAQTTDKDVLRTIYGVGPVAGTTPQASVDGLAHLTLITCAGTFDTALGTHDHRLAVFAVRV